MITNSVLLNQVFWKILNANSWIDVFISEDMGRRRWRLFIWDLQGMLAIGQYNCIYVIWIKVMFLKGHCDTCLEFVWKPALLDKGVIVTQCPKLLQYFGLLNMHLVPYMKSLPPYLYSLNTRIMSTMFQELFLVLSVQKWIRPCLRSL